MTHQDRFGLALSTASAEAAQAWQRGTDRMLCFWPGMVADFDAAIAADADFALAYAGRARARMMQGAMEPARADCTRAEALVLRNGDAREQSHVAILARMLAGQAQAALRATLSHLDLWPRDALVFSYALGAFGLFAFSGMADHDQARLGLCARHARHYGEDWWFLVAEGWSRTEAGDPRGGLAETERGFALRPENAHAIHALSHALFEQGAMAEAEARIAAFLPGYAPDALLYGHVSWHLALSLLDRGDVAGTLALYAARLAPGVSASPPLNQISDGAALLWRLHLAGVTIPQALWRDLSAYATPRFPPGGNGFTELHMAILLAAGGEIAALEARIAAAEARVQAGGLPAGPVVTALARAFADFAEERYAAAARRLAVCAAETVRLGGSHAQREIVEDTCLIAHMRAGEAEAARAMLHARLARRPSARDGRLLAGLA
ncbi:MAG: hypothetical protein KGL12_03285 [Rhodospirillales bacterium]|nr:hypothetical protein [Rhodospirillales bacterium]